MREQRPLTTGEIAKRCHVTPMAVVKWIRQRKLDAYRTPGGHYRVPRTAFTEFLSRYPMDGDEPQATEQARVLIVDDQPGIIASIEETLRLGGEPYKIESAMDGYEALLQIGLFRPDLLVLDLRLPGLDGFEVCRRLRAKPETRPIKILAISAYEEAEYRPAALTAGADAFLAKPFDAQTIQHMVAGLLLTGNR